MDRLALVALAVAACGAPATPSSGTGRAWRSAQAPTTAATGLRTARALSRGTLSYAVAYAGARIVSIELGTGFELVVRSLRGSVRGRVALGEAAYDVVDLAVHDDTAWVAAMDGRVRAVDLATMTVATTWHLGAPATAIAVSADGAYLATGDATGVVCLRRGADSALLQCVVAHDGPVSALDFSRGGDARALASAAWSGEVTVWSVPSLAVTAQHRRRGSATDIAFDRTGARIAVAWSSTPPQRSPAVARREAAEGFGPPDPLATVEILRPSGEVIATCTGHAAAVTSVAWTHDGARVASGSWDRTVRLWNATTCKQVARLSGWAYLVRDVAADGAGHRLAIAAWGVSPEARATTLVDLLY